MVVALTVLGVPLVLFAAYLVPRWLTQPRAETVADRVIPLLRPWSRVVGLLLPARTATRPTDLRSIWREGAAVGLRADDELLLVGGVMAFSVRPVREVMTPRTDIVAIDEHSALDDIRMVFAQSGYSRIPVFRETLDDIIGMLHAFDLFRLAPGDPLPVRPVAVTPASRSCGDLLLDMQRERRHLAVVLDEFGGTLGIATLEDLLEELVGEIFDEHDDGVRTAAASGPVLFETDGNISPEAIEERFGVSLPEGRSTTVAGLLAEWAGRIPNAGERFTIRGLEFDVLQASPTRIERLLIRSGTAAPRHAAAGRLVSAPERHSRPDGRPRADGARSRTSSGAPTNSRPPISPTCSPRSTTQRSSDGGAGAAPRAFEPGAGRDAGGGARRGHAGGAGAGAGGRDRRGARRRRRGRHPRRARTRRTRSASSRRSSTGPTSSGCSATTRRPPAGA